ncbi:HAD-IIA family hydrolase [Anoxynatronum buryatiense]|uniref:HAD-IIA family hydrolase n=1 Tax=Anoxynatronum buryatiense TaxID=489973 RepID=UPI0024B7C128|nr:HAD-IIA family hydrolase [Anoxynatronum buryatiense]
MKEYATYLFDIDGTLLRQNRVLNGVDHFLKRLRNRQKQVLFVTNTPLQTGKMLATKLNRLGIQAAESEIVTPVDALHQYLHFQACPQLTPPQQQQAQSQARHQSQLQDRPQPQQQQTQTQIHPQQQAQSQARPQNQPQPVRLLGVIHPEVAKEISRRGWTIDHVAAAGNRREYTHVLLGMYMELDCRQLAKGLQQLDRGAHLLVMNPDVYCPVEQGRILDSGALSKLYEACIPHEPVFLGKPLRWMQQAVKEKLTAPPAQCLFVGDSPYTDMPMGRALEMDTLFLRSGITEFMDDRPQVEATYTYASMEHLPLPEPVSGSVSLTVNRKGEPA